MDSRSESDSSTTVKAKPRRDRHRDRSKVSAKAVVRHLPPAMSEEEFRTAVDPLPPHNFFYFSKADHGLGVFSFSRAYINFLTFKDMEQFRDKFDGYVFVDSRGNEFPAVVEFAPFQKIASVYWHPAKKKRDKKCATIADDPDYLSFLESLETVKNETLPSAETFLEELEARDKELKANRGCPKVITPCMEAVLAKYSNKPKKRDDRRADERKARNDRVREEKSKPKDSSGKKDNNEKTGTSSRKERRNEKRRRDRKEKQKNMTGSEANQTAAPVKVLQKEKSQSKESLRPKQQFAPFKSAAQKNGHQPRTNSNAHSSTAQSQHHQSNEQKQKPDRRPTAAKSEAAPKESAGESKNQKKEPRVAERDSAGARKERIPNKDRPAIPIYRPGSKKSDPAGDIRRPENHSSREENGNATTKTSERRNENQKSDQPANGTGKSWTRNRPQRTAKGENAGSFRTKVFSRKPNAGPAV